MAKAAERGIGLSNKHGPASTVVLMHREGLDDTDIANLSSSLGVRVLCLVDVMNSSSPASIGSLPSLTSDTLATIVYTSGTTGRPKVCSDFCFVSRLFTYGSLKLTFVSALVFNHQGSYALSWQSPSPNHAQVCS